MMEKQHYGDGKDDDLIFIKSSVKNSGGTITTWA